MWKRKLDSTSAVWKCKPNCVLKCWGNSVSSKSFLFVFEAKKTFPNKQSLVLLAGIFKCCINGIISYISCSLLLHSTLFLSSVYIGVSRLSLFLLIALWRFMPHLSLTSLKDIYVVSSFSILHWSAKSSITVQISLYMCECVYMVALYLRGMHIFTSARYHQITFVLPAFYFPHPTQIDMVTLSDEWKAMCL